MAHLFIRAGRIAGLTLASVCIAGAGIAKDHGNSGHGNGQGKHSEVRGAELRDDRAESGPRQRQEVRPGAYFNDEHRTHAREYYSQTYANARRCPPGLAKNTTAACRPDKPRNGSSANQYHGACLFIPSSSRCCASCHRRLMATDMRA